VIEIVAHSETMREAVRLADRVATTDANVLVTGESGVGKDAIAFYIHSKSSRAAQSFVKICTSLIVSTEVQGVLMNSQRSAKSSTTLGSSVMKCRERTFNPCRCKPVFSGE